MLAGGPFGRGAQTVYSEDERMILRGRTFLTAAACLATGVLTACASTSGEVAPEGGRDRGGILPSFLGGGGANDAAEEDGIGVNSFLWRAAHDTISFMPLQSSDPFGGVIITDWFADPAAPNERFKATVYILDTRLRADALNVSVFRQVLTADGWVDAAVDPDTGVQIENAILRRAREIRLSTLRE